MFKKMKIGTKLVLIGGILIVLPIVIIAYFAITEAGDNMKNLEAEQLQNRTAEIVEGIDNVLSAEKDFARILAAMPLTKEALKAGYNPDMEELSPEVNALVQNNLALMSEPRIAEVYIAFITLDAKGVVVASDNSDTIGLDLSERDYVQGALQGNVTIGAPAVDKVDGFLFIGVSAPVKDEGGRIIGVAAALVRLDFLGALIANATIGETGYAFLIDANGLIIAHPKDESLIMSTNIGDLEGMEEITRRTLAGENGVEHYVYEGDPKTAGFASVPTTGWSVVLSLPDIEYLAPINAVRNLIILIGVIAFIIAMVIFILFSRSITKPLRRAVDFAGEVAAGDLSVDLNIRQKDEIGVLAEALRNMLKALQYKAKIVERIADGDLTVDIEKASEKDGLGESLLVMKSSLTDIMSQIMSAADQVTTGSDQVSQASQSLSQGATEQASSLEEISSSLNEINSQSKQNAENAVEANALAKQSAKGAEDGNQEMKQLTEAMGAINASSDEIKKVVKVIDDIAFQINLLALNANVEAARAGKYGKGFAVVAEEVRNLAVRAASAVKETTAMVEDSITNIERGNKSVDSTAKQLDEIVGSIAKVATFLDEIAVASKEQALGIEQITEGLDQIEQVTQANTASAEESASASEELAGQAQELQMLISRFKLEGAENLRLAAPTGGREKQKKTAAPIKGVGRETSGRRQPERRHETEETAIRPVNPAEVIQLDDDDFDRF